MSKFKSFLAVSVAMTFSLFNGAKADILGSCVDETEEAPKSFLRIIQTKKNLVNVNFRPTVELKENVLLKAVENIVSGQIKHEVVEIKIQDSTSPCEVRELISYTGNSNRSILLKKGLKIDVYNKKTEMILNYYDGYLVMEDRNRGVRIDLQVKRSGVKECQMIDLKNLLKDKQSVVKLNFITPKSSTDCLLYETPEEISLKKAKNSNGKKV